MGNWSAYSQTRAVLSSEALTRNRSAASTSILFTFALRPGFDAQIRLDGLCVSTRPSYQQKNYTPHNRSARYYIREKAISNYAVARFLGVRSGCVLGKFRTEL